ncbi:MAG: AMP-binding protein, partial [Candidatus Eremiobacteraeota bacterium]|nr:AMP-binding protein [Candidatus Eremiobacteraeota bacterium]
LGTREREQMLVEWNDTARPYASDSSLAALFEAHVRRDPLAIAVACDGAEVTYGELNALADALAGELRERGLAPEELVGICAERSIGMVVATLSVIKAGGAYLPIDPEYPAQRIGHLLGEAGVRFVLTQQRAMTNLPSDGASVVAIDIDAERRAPAAAYPAPGGGERLAFVLYTSGSTGTPKGVMLTQRGVVRLVTDTNYISIDETDVVAQVSSFTFDAVTFEMWGALLHGARLEIASREIVLTPGDFSRWLEARGITVMLLTTALFRLMSRTRPDAFARLRCLLTGGEAIDPQSMSAVLEAGPPGRLINAYGPTEVTTVATTFELKGPCPEGVPIGRPISNTQAFVLDGDLNPLP